MTPEELDEATVKEAKRLTDAAGLCDWPSVAQTAARLAREGWTPPETVDPDLLAARAWAETTDMGAPTLYDDGSYDTEPEIIGFLAGCTRGREGAKGLVEALEALDRRFLELWPHGPDGHPATLDEADAAIWRKTLTALAAAKGERV